MTARAIKMRERREYRDASIAYYEKMVACYKEMFTEAERAAYDEWERTRPLGMRDSDWPGWEKYLGKAPWDRPQIAPRLASVRLQ